MATFKDTVGNMFGQFGTFWSELSIAKKSISIAVLAGTIGALVYAVSANTKTEQEYLFVNLSQDDISDISQNLKASGFEDFIVDKKGIKVNKEDILRLRMQVAQAGLPKQGVVGWEKFDEDNFTRTEFEQNIQKLRAIQGELSRTIMAINGVKSARVHLVTPKSSLFVRDEKKPTASIYIRYDRGGSLTKAQIKGIQHLVAHAVEGLEKNAVSIVDQDGNTLTEEESNSFASKMTKELLAYKKEVETKLEKKIESIVGKVVGPERIEAKVDADVDFTQEKQTISDVDPDDAGVLSKTTTGFSMEGQGLNPTGIPGSKSNVPGEQEELAVNQSKAGSKRESELINFELSKVVSEKTLAIGNIKRLTVSVLVDGKQIYPLDGTVPKFEPRSTEEMEQITSLIKNAVGYKADRDSLSVENMMFQIDPLQLIEIKEQRKEDREYFTTIALSGLAAIALGLFFMFIVRPYLRWLTYDPEKKEKEKYVEEFQADLELGQKQSIQVQEDVPFEKLTPTEQVQFLAKHEPKRTTEAIRILLNPHQNQGA